MKYTTKGVFYDTFCCRYPLIVVHSLRIPGVFYVYILYIHSTTDGSHTDLKEKIRINLAIRSPELRVIGAQGENYGVITRAEALGHAETANLDLIEISPNAVPPVAKIMDYGKYQYEISKKQREMKSKSHTTETKGIQVKIGTGEHDLSLKARRAAEWLTEGHRVKVDLFLWGRYKSMEEAFLKERLERFLKLIPADYKIAEPIKRSPKGFTSTIERVAKVKEPKAPKEAPPTPTPNQ